MVSVPARMEYDLLNDDYLQRSDVTRLYFNMTPWFNQSGDTMSCVWGRQHNGYMKNMIYINNILRKRSPFPYTKQHYTNYRIECLLQKEKIIIFFFLKFRLTTTDKRCVTSIMYGKYIKEKKSHIF